MAEKIRLEDRECPLSATLGLVGEWWTLLILHDAFDGYTRFDQFQENLGISSSLLTSRLKRLVAGGLLERRQYQTNPPRYEYVLTDLGRSLRPVIVVLAAWGNARLAPEQRSMVLVDAETGVEAEPVVVDRRPVDESTARTSSSPPAPPPASRSATATPGAPPRRPRLGTPRIQNDDAHETQGVDDVDAGVLTTEVTTAVFFAVADSRPAGWLNRHSSVRGDQHRTEGKVLGPTMARGD